MKKIKFLFLIFFVIGLISILFSCQKSEPDVTQTGSTTTEVTTTAVTTTAADNFKVDLSEYTVIRYEKEKDATLTAVANFRSLIKNATGYNIKVKIDEVRKGETLDESKPEILIGNTNRSASKAAIERLNESETRDYIIEIKDNKIVLAGKNDTALYYAMREFVRLYVSPLDKTTVLAVNSEVSIVGNISDKLYVMNDFMCAEVTDDNVIQSALKNYNLMPTYQRLVKLEHNGDNNGTLFVTGQWSQNSFPIYRSTDDGKNWTLITTVVEMFDTSLNGNWQPHIFELPNKVGDMPEGTLLLAGCSHADSRTAMCIWRSFDLGKTWEEYTIVDKHNGPGGLWEPFLICDEDGSLVCFYSDESEVSDYGGQRLVFKVSKDGKTWGEKKYCVAPENKHLRPGMVTVAKAGDNGYVMAYEMIGSSTLNGILYSKSSESLTEWDYTDYGTLIKTEQNVVASHTPYCEWTPLGGELGTVFVTGQHGGYDKIPSSDIFVSYDLGKTWNSFTNPFKFDFVKNAPGNYAYSPGFFTDKDGIVYYVNNVFPEYEKYIYLYADTRVAKIKMYSINEEVKSTVNE